MRIALITGATSGIGKAIAYALAAAGFKLVLTGRRADRLVELTDKLTEKYGGHFTYLAFDVRDNIAVVKAMESIPEGFKAVDVLVNNAGLAVGLSHIQNGVIDDWERMIDTNVKGLLYVTRAVAPAMIARSAGHIINVGSIAGKEVYENGGVYCATKHAVDALTKAMRIDMVKHGIKVTSVCPGAVETEFSIVRFKGDEARASSVYAGFEPLTAEDIAGVVAYIVTLPKHVCVNDILVTPTAQATASCIYKT